jgi:hypothetical protein
MPRRRLSPEQIETIRHTPGPCRAVAAVVGCSKSTVAYHWAKFDDLDSPEPPDMMQFEPLKIAKKCNRHGPTMVWPCVRCAAESAIYDS